MKELKKTYFAPAIEEIKLDREISLGMLSEYTGPGDPFNTVSPATTTETEETKSSTEQSSFEENPFKK